MKKNIEIEFNYLIDKVSTNNSKIKQKQYLEFGDYPIVDQGKEIIGGYTNEKIKLINCQLPVIVFGDHTKCVKYIDFDFASGADGTIVLESKGYTDSRYLYYLSEFLVFTIKDKGYARHFQHLSKQLAPLFSLPEQRSIVSKIEELFSKLNVGVENLKQAQQKLTVYKQSVLKQAFEGKLTEEWRIQRALSGVEVPTAEELLKQIQEEREKHYQQQLEDWKLAVIEWENGGKEGKKPGKPKIGKDYFSIIKSEEIERYSKIPKDWVWVKNEDISSKITDGEHITPQRTLVGYYLLSARNIHNGKIIYDNVDYVGEDEYRRIRKRCDPEFGDILISCSGSVGRVAHVPKESNFVMVRSVALIKLYSKLSFYKFQEYQLQSPILQSQIDKGKKATAQANLFLGPIGNLNMIYCSLEEQHQIVQEIERRFSVCEKLEQTIEESIQKAEALRQSILKKAFAGELLTPQELAECKQQPGWEPAEKLLEKIKKEKKK